MALKATVYKTELEIVDMDRNVYETRQLTLARKLKLRWSV
ncbi:MAG: YaeQ family protein [Treponemataceae bacterium]